MRLLNEWLHDQQVLPQPFCNSLSLMADVTLLQSPYLHMHVSASADPDIHGCRFLQVFPWIYLRITCSESASVANLTVKCHEIEEECYFDMANLSHYDLILGTPFLYQHQVSIGFNEARVTIGSMKSLPIKGTNVLKLSARTVDFV